MSKTTALVLALALSLSVGACRSAKNVDNAFFEEVGTLSKDEIMARGDAAAGKKRWADARRYYSFLADSFPNDPAGRRAALKVADTFYRDKSSESLTEAQLRYRDFVNRFPSDANRAYALLMLGKVSAQQGRGALRDLTPIREAAASFRQVIELYPDSEHAAEARTLLAEAIEDLALHELEVARYYMRTDSAEGARRRLEFLLANYPESKAAVEAAALLKSLGETTGQPSSPERSGEQPSSPPSGR